jgi:general secretion pathway protein G
MKKSIRNNSAFTLVEIMVVIVIIGILAAAIIPQFVGTTEDAKVSTAKADISQLENALERFNLNLDRYPTTEEGLKALTEAPAGDEEKWRGPYVKVLRADPWGKPYQYRVPGMHHASTFDLWSGGGPNGKEIGNWN